MKLSISIVDNAGPKVPFVLRDSYCDSIKLAGEIGYDAVEMHIREPKSIDPFSIKALCEKEGIAVSSVGTGLSYAIDGLSFMNNDEAIRSRAVDRMKEYIGLAQTLDSVVIIGLIKGLVPNGEDYSKYEQRVVECLKVCLEEAERKNVTLVIEGINRYESNFLVNIDEILSFIEKFNSKFLKVHIDTFHMNIEEADFRESILKCKDHLGHVHFADSDRFYPGHGHIDFKGIMNSLDEAGYNGYIAIECLALPEPKEVAVRTINYLKSL